jgi:hypothetical protein
VPLGDSAAVAATGVVATQSVNPCMKHCVADFQRELRTAMVGSIALGSAIVVGGQLASGAAGSLSVAVQIAVAVLGGLGVFVSLLVAADHRWVPSREILQWQADRVAYYFADIDGNRESPRNPQETLDRVAGKEGPGALFQRIGALHLLGRDEEAKVLLDSWNPAELIETVRRERMSALVDRADAASHLDRARAAVELIEDEEERSVQRANLIIDAARVRRQDNWPGLDALAGARRELGRFYTPSPPPAKKPRDLIRGLAFWLGTAIAGLALLIPLFR